MGDTKDAIAALMRERELIKSVSTWPWDPRMIRGFASALLLPVFLWLITRLLERLLKSVLIHGRSAASRR